MNKLGYDDRCFTRLGRGFYDILETSKAPVIASHSGARVYVIIQGISMMKCLLPGR